MLAVPSALLAGALAIGRVPDLADGALHAVHSKDGTPPHWAAHGILLGLLSTALACGFAADASHRPARLPEPAWACVLRRMQSGHIGEYVAWLLVGTTVLGVLVLSGGAVGWCCPRELTGRWCCRETRRLRTALRTPVISRTPV